MPYRFWNWQNADCEPLKPQAFANPREMYDLLAHSWCAETCAPRLRSKWSTDNMTEGQCSITAFLAQDFFGGDVYGVKLPDGAYHCYNVVDGKAFDLTSEQFGDEVLDYSTGVPQSREEHFADADKYTRYLLLFKRLIEAIGDNKSPKEPAAQPLATAHIDYDREVYNWLNRKQVISAVLWLIVGLALLGGGLAMAIVWHSVLSYSLAGMGAAFSIFGSIVLVMVGRNTRKALAQKIQTDTDFFPDHMIIHTRSFGEQTGVEKIYYRNLEYYQMTERHILICPNPQRVIRYVKSDDSDKIIEALNRNLVKYKF